MGLDGECQKECGLKVPAHNNVYMPWRCKEELIFIFVSGTSYARALAVMCHHTWRTKSQIYEMDTIIFSGNPCQLFIVWADYNLV
jgi:hypothetical protein